VYLGATFRKDGSCSPEIRKRLAMGRSVMQSLSKIWKSKQVTRSTKVRLVSALVCRSVVTYGSDGWIIHKAEEKQIEAFEMWCYRRVLRVSWIDHRTNEWVLSRLEVEKSLLARIRTLKLSYYGHMMRKANCLEKDIIPMSAFQGAEVGGDQGDDGRKTSVTGRVFGSTMQQDLRKTGRVGEGSYVPPTLQLEDGNKRRVHVQCRRKKVHVRYLIC